MILKNVTIENFRMIENCKIEFDSKFNLIIGNNATGKTSVLEAIKVGLGGFLAGVDGVKTVHFSKDDVRRTSSLMGMGSYDIQYHTPTTVHCVTDFDGKEIIWNRSKSSYQSSRTTVMPKKISNYSSKIIQEKNSILPIISYQSAGRMWSQKRDKWEDVFKGNYSRSVGYTDCLASESNIKLITNWCKRMEQISWQQEKKIAEYEAVKKAVSIFMNTLENCDNKSTIFYDKRTEELVYSSEGETIPMRFMSAGYRSLIGMIVDIAYRMAVLNPNLEEDIIEKTNGIILIDEIDVHIHPKWQWKIVDALMNTFPSVQFIATTHSPIVVASCKDKNIINLFDSDKSTSRIEFANNYKKSAYGWQVNDVLKEYMEVDERSPEFKVKLKEIEKLSLEKIKKQLTEEGKTKLKELKDEIYSNLPENDAVIEVTELGTIEEIINGRGE
ncbi:AAA family ATPase [Clostridium sp. FP2]|uniref:AAA family ATPase n=1 Tax=Clostridium sp. FP2 TaxID=2724481 RepID=UPI0013E92114|nr:AAA family ATPase [Clostridium sp. FP2]MBZ9624736.1 AAA family ATPase [Clostridium sp. FP2]